MKVYCQFKVLSTGYVPNSIPPQFKEELKKPVNMLGSDGVYVLDGRLSLASMFGLCKDRMEKLGKSIIGFEIIKSDRFTNDGKVMYTYIE